MESRGSLVSRTSAPTTMTVASPTMDPSMMSAATKGKSVGEVRALTRAFKSMMSIHEHELDGEAADEAALATVKLGDLEALRGVVKFPVRIKCATLSWITLAQALDEVVPGSSGGEG